MDRALQDVYGESIPALSPETVRAAQRTVVRHVDDSGDCVVILQALGINERC